MLQIDSSNGIRLDGVSTGLAVAQRSTGTVVYTRSYSPAGYREHPMPHPRYATSHDAPAFGVPGRDALEADIRSLLARI